MDGWTVGLGAIFQLEPLILVTTGALLGIVVGALPGLTATMTIAILLPFSFSFEPVSGIALLLGVYIGALFAGSIPAVLLRTPGTPSAAATIIDGYPMTLQGRAGQALTVSAIGSGVGGILGGLLLGLAAPAVAKVALLVTSPTYFMLAVFGLVMIASISDRQLVKGMAAGLIGVTISFIGFDPIQGIPRFTFGTDALLGGLGIVPLLIGLFGVSEALRAYEDRPATPRTSRGLGRSGLSRSEAQSLPPTLLASSGIGFGIGVLPGIGGDIGAFVAYNETKRFSRSRTRFGQGEPKGVAAAESANSASTAGALVPMLTLGIPGDTVTAILIGAITVHGLRPGPQLFSGSPELVYGIFIAVIVASFLVLVLGLAGVRVWMQILKVPTTFLWPAVLACCVVGSYALRSSLIDVMIMVLAGVLGYFLSRGNFPLSPVVIGLILGPLIEENYRRAMSVHGDHSWLLAPMQLVLITLTALSVVVAVIRLRRDHAENGRIREPT